MSFYFGFLKFTSHFQSFGNILSVLTVFHHCSILPSLIMTLDSAQFLRSLQFKPFRWPETALQRHPLLKQFRVLITPRQQSPILPLPTRHFLALTPIYHHPLIHSTFSFHSHVFVLTIHSPLPYQTARSFPCEHSIHPGKHW